MKLFQRKENKKTEEKNAFKELRCPYCGQIISSTDTKCPACQNELARKNVSYLIRDFSNKIEGYEQGLISKQFKITTTLEIKYIRSFNVPNDKGLMNEFMVYVLNKAEQLCESNVAFKLEKIDLAKAWSDKARELKNIGESLWPEDTFFERKYKKIKECEKKTKLKVYIPLIIVVVLLIIFIVASIILGTMSERGMLS